MGGPSRPHRRCSPPFRAWHRGNLRTASAVGYPPSNTWIVTWSTRPRRVANLIKGPRSVPGTSNTTRPPLSFSPSILIADTLSAIAATNVIGSSGAFAIGLPLPHHDGQVAVVPFPLHLTLQVPLHFRPPPLQGRHLAGGDLGAREQFVVRFHPVSLLRAERATELVVVDQRPFGEGLPAPLADAADAHVQQNPDSQNRSVCPVSGSSRSTVASGRRARCKYSACSLSLTRIVSSSATAFMKSLG